MPKPTLRIMGVHGLGDHRAGTWIDDWERTLQTVVPRQEGQTIEFIPFSYDDVFADLDLSVWDTMQAVWKLTRSGVVSALGGRRGALDDVNDRVKWTAGYVVAWVANAGFQTRSRRKLLAAVRKAAPDVILAHSLGSLVTYQAFAHPDAARPGVAETIARMHYVTLGSQLGNAFVVGNLADGRLEPLPVRTWHHLYNENDDVFTAPIRLPAMPTFRQIETPFDDPGFADHTATSYLQHVATVENLWRPLVEERLTAPRAFGTLRPRTLKPAAAAEKGRRTRRALLVGINAYPQEADRLEGCVNDVFLMSSVLQECGFPAESIRVCLDERATTRGILDRLHWLLDDPRPGDERVFYYSGHGATVPQYGDNLEPDRKVETLVPWDFDWSLEHAIVDDQIFGLYSQLPYDLRFAMILDCCHSGGMHRQGGPRARGLTPPDDVRHRELRWDTDADMWVPRDFTPLNGAFSRDADARVAFFGTDGATTRLGRASLVRTESERAYRRRTERAASTKVGPYLPLVLEACGEQELSYEYRHGATSYGAFTFSLALELRARKRLTFRKLVEATAHRLRALDYDQRPQILGPAAIVNARVPWRD